MPGGGSCELLALAGAVTVDEGGKIATLDGPAATPGQIAIARRSLGWSNRTKGPS